MSRVIPGTGVRPGDTLLADWAGQMNRKRVPIRPPMKVTDVRVHRGELLVTAEDGRRVAYVANEDVEIR